METTKMYQVSTLQALAMGYTRSVITVGDLRAHGDIGLGTFEHVDGEMIMVDNTCYRAIEDGSVEKAPDTMGVPFASVAPMVGSRTFAVDPMPNIDTLKEFLTLRIEEGFGLNSMHVIRIDGHFRKVDARSESGYRSQHITLKEVLSVTQRDFIFEEISGTLVCVYYPDYMDGINAAGWHLHFISQDRTQGGHVFDLDMTAGDATLMKIDCIEIQMPCDPAFDVYSLKDSSQDDIKEVEQGRKSR